MGDLLEFMLIAVPMAGGIAGIAYLVRRKMNALGLELAEERGANRTAQIATEKTQLEERVRVLERIVTSRGYTVAEEIEALRDTREVEDSGSGIPLNIDAKEKA